jgi:hypothetical protein
MTGTNCDLFTHKSSRSYLNHLVYVYEYYRLRTPQLLRLDSLHIILSTYEKKLMAGRLRTFPYITTSFNTNPL